MPRARIFGSGLNMGGVQPAGGGVTYLLRDEFTTDAAAPLASPRNAEPGPGTLTITDSTNVMSIASAALTKTGTQASAWTDPRVLATITRAAGRAFISTVNTGSQMMIALLNNSAGGNANVEHGLYWSSSTAINAYQSSAAAALPAVTASTTYQAIFVLRTSGAYMFVKGGTQFASWTLVWVFVSGNTATLYGSPIYNGTGTVTHDYIRVTDLGAPFSTDALATINVTSATQSVGAELLTNGDFSAWTGTYPNRNPNSWSVQAESGTTEISEVGSAEGHGGAGTGSANFWVSGGGNANMFQVALTVNTIYEVAGSLSLRNSGSLRVRDASGVYKDVPTAGAFKIINRASHAQFQLVALGDPCDVTLDAVTVKPLTLNTAQTVEASSILDHTFTLPVSPVAGSQTHLLPRISASGEELLNCWDAYLVRNDANSAWDFKYDSIASGTRTGRTTVAGVGNVDTIRVITNLNAHDTYTKVGSTWTKRGSTITSALYNTATLCNTVYTSDFTFGSLVAWPVTHANYNALNNV